MNQNSYFEISKLKDEELIYQERVSLPLIVGLVGFGGFLLVLSIIFGSLVFLILGVVFALYAVSLYLTSEYVISNKRILSKTGLIKRHVVELRIKQVESITLEQSILGRILNYGTLVFSGAGNPVVKIELIQNPIQFRAKCLELSQNDKK